MRYPLFFSGLALLLAASGCRIEGGLTPSRVIHRSPDRSDEASRPRGGGSADRAGGPADRAGGHSGGASSSGGAAYSPNCPTPGNHCLTDEDVLVAKGALDGAYVYAHVGVQQGEPTTDGEAQFFMRHNGETTSTRHYHYTRPAAPDELAVGMPVAIFNRNKNDGIYDPPENREDAQGERWWIAKVASVDPLPHGYVIVSGGYKVRAHGLRAIEGDDSPTTAATGAEDEHFLRENHYLVTSGNVRDGGYTYLHVGAPIQEPSAETRGEGHFIQLHDGNVYWTESAFRTRPATESDVSVGTRVFMFNRNKNNDIYEGPENRTDALTDRWWTAKVTDDSQLYKGVVIVAGDYAVSLEGLRVEY